MNRLLATLIENTISLDDFFRHQEDADRYQKRALGLPGGAPPHPGTPGLLSQDLMRQAISSELDALASLGRLYRSREREDQMDDRLRFDLNRDPIDVAIDGLLALALAELLGYYARADQVDQGRLVAELWKERQDRLPANFDFRLVVARLPAGEKTQK